MAKKALGKGLGAIISASPTPVEEIERVVTEDKGRVIDIDIDKIMPNPDQPRTIFDESEIKGLAESISPVGLIQPIIVREKDGTFIVVAGERRLRASKLIQAKKIKAIKLEADEELNFCLALIENIQRSDLNPIEEARAYKMLINKFKLKQVDVAKKVGKERATVTNSLRLLNLPEELQEGLISRLITTGHAKVLLSIEDSNKQIKLFHEIVEKGISVRALEAILNAGKDSENPEDESEKTVIKKSPQIKKMEDDLVSKLGTKVEIKHSGNKGRIEISYYSLDDFDRIMEIIK